MAKSTIEAMKKLHDERLALEADPGWGTGTEAGSFNLNWPSICPRSMLTVWSYGKLVLNFGLMNTSKKVTAFRDKLKEKVEQKLKFEVPSDYKGKYPPYEDSVWVPKVDLPLGVLKELLLQD